MSKFLIKPHNWFFLAAPIFYIASLIYSKNSDIDIQLHDTMFVIGAMHFYLLPCILFSIWGILFLLLGQLSKPQPNKVASFTHFLVTITFPVYITLFLNPSAPAIPQYDSYKNFETFSSFEGFGFIVWLTLFYLAEQALFFLYVTYCLIKSRLQAQ